MFISNEFNLVFLKRTIPLDKSLEVEIASESEIQFQPQLTYFNCMVEEFCIGGSAIGSSSSSRIARYLTQKGATVDSSIQWLNAYPESSKKRSSELVSPEASLDTQQYHTAILENPIKKPKTRVYDTAEVQETTFTRDSDHWLDAQKHEVPAHSGCFRADVCRRPALPRAVSHWSLHWIAQPASGSPELCCARIKL